MCGIAAYIGEDKASKILLNSIKKLEYRGYDSCGIVTISNKGITCKKGIGKIDDVDERLNLTELGGNIGIAHTRWATHGEPSDANSHPHFSCNGDIFIVHNGIIENAEELKKVLGDHTFRSQTDSEVVAHLIEDFINQGDLMKDAFVKTLKLIKGAYAIVAINKNDPEKLYAAKQSSPLVIGLGEREILVA